LPVNFPDASVPVVGSDGIITKDWYPVLRLLVDQANTSEANLADTSSGLDTKATLDQTDAFYGMILVPANQAYSLVINLAYGLTITEISTISTSGTCTATFSISGTPLGGSANSVSASGDLQAHSSANVAAAGDDIEVTISANASCLNLSFAIKYTYALA
jgi:hypothetical protein